MSRGEGMRIAGVIVAVVLSTLAALLVIGLIAVYGFGMFQRSTADFRGKTAQIEATKANAAFRLAAYDSFFDLCAAVQSDEATMAALRDERAGGPSASRREQIDGALTALRSARAEKINRYNANARKDWTTGPFQAAGLPFQLSTTSEITSCAV